MSSRPSTALFALIGPILLVGCSALPATSPLANQTSQASSQASQVPTPAIEQSASPSATETVEPVATPEPTPTDSPSASPLNTPTAPATPVATDSPVPSLLPGTSPVLVADANEEQIHKFWSHIIDLSCVEFVEENEWSSVATMTDDVELVVIARPQSVAYTPDDATYHDSPIITLAIDEVLKGSPMTMPDGSIQLYVDYDELETIDQEPIPDVPTLMFLRPMDVGRPGSGLPGSEHMYYLPTTYQNVMVDLNGRVFLPMEARMRDWLGNQTWPLELQRTSFEKVIDEVRSVAGEGRSSGGTGSRRLLAC